MSTLVICYRVEVVFTAEVLHRYRYSVNVSEKSVHARAGGEFTFLDEIDSVLYRLRVREDDYWVLGFSEDGVVTFHRNRKTQSFNLTA